MMTYVPATMRCFFALTILLAVTSVSADQISLVRVGEDWRYFKGTSEPSNPMSDWRQLSFDDSSWAVGPSGFGYEDQDDATVLSDMVNNYWSVYIRRKFTVDNPADIKWLILRIDYDDGFVAYINGTEVWRRGLASDPAYNQAASPARESGPAEEIDISFFLNLLVPGENVLAIQGHNTTLSSSDFSLTPELISNFIRGPFVQDARTNGVKVIWKTPRSSDSLVEYGTTPAMGSSLFSAGYTSNHVTKLSGIQPGTVYYYRISSSDGSDTAVSPVYNFTTMKSSGGLSFAVLGDSGEGTEGQYGVAGAIRLRDTDLAVIVGDVVYPYFTHGRADLKCLSVYGEHMRSAPYYFAVGNHDIILDGVEEAHAYLDAFYLPTNSVTGTEHYYSFDHGDAHFVVLSTDMRLYPYSVGSDQYNWLAADLAASTKPWKFLFFHHPPFTSSTHRFDDNDGDSTPDRFELQDSIGALASQYGVQMMFYGHDHNYESFNPVGGVHSVLTGGGGRALRDINANPADIDVASAQFWKNHHAVKVTIEGDSLKMEAIDKHNTVFDVMYIQREMPPPQTWHSSWFSPIVESGTGGDDGNHPGQQFDFIGTPIPTIPGDFANLGRVFVNNDQTNLYVAFERSLIYGDNNVFLFVDVPTLSGVSSMAGVGNGIVDPLGQGADGLDFLENLSFMNFTPDVGAILGDEYGDGQFREFARPGLAFNIGQGVYRLEASLSDVPDTRLQQYNRTPQGSGVAYEQNANLVEVCIPLSSIGNLQPGQTIQVGAMVAGSGVDTNGAVQSRYLDTAHLGQTLSGSGFGAVVLEGLNVRLTAANEDPDADGLTNEEEASLGTRPDKSDTDGDELLDGWEEAGGLNPLSASGDDGADGDPDGDGSANWKEQVAGTLPLDGSSVLAGSLEMIPGDKLVLSWPSATGRSYTIHAADTMTDSYSPVVTDLPAAPLW
ncbi:MAG: metallophosphoesterase family protein, partial [Verrucomicrobia bacterium]|nr:metallophosphoesterase family protein [Verrucomicrobiota bacterium]